MVAIVDYGVGNLFSLVSSLKAIGVPAVITADPGQIRAAERLILPGVGAFGDAMEKLSENGLDRLVKEQAQGGKPLLGICLGMQMLFEESEEFGCHRGLGLLAGSVVSMRGRLPEDRNLKIPHIGWNRLHFVRQNPLFRYISEGDCVYFVHSYYADRCEKSRIATAEYGIELTAAVAENNIFGCQFHPEKSGSVGLNILRAFCGTGEGR